MLRPGQRTLRTLLVLALALAFRTARIGESPPGFNHDEAYAARNSARFASGAEPLALLRLYPHGVSQQLLGGYQPGFYYAWSASFLRAAGWSRTAWRWTSIAPSVAMVLLLYPLGARLLGERRAFLAALLLAGSRWHASDGRWGWVVVFAALLGLAGLLLVAGAARWGLALPAAAGGLLVGLAVPCYGAAVPPALASGVLLAWPRPRAKLLGAWALGLALGSVPLAVMAVRQPAELLARGRAASVLADAGSLSQLPLFVTGNVIHYAGMFHVAGDPLSWHTLPRTPALDVASGAALAIGLALAVRRPRRPASMLALVLLLAPLAAGLAAQTTDAPNQYRVGLAAPGAALLSASGLLVPARALRRRRLTGAAAVPWAVAGASVALNAWFLLVSWPSHPTSFDGSGGLEATLAADFERVRAAGGTVAVSPLLVRDRLLLDLAVARTLAEAAAAGTAARIPYAVARTAPPGTVFFAPPAEARGEPRRDRWGRVLYCVVPPGPGS